ncbi:MAG TPA: uridine kinase [Acidobacteriota bacterium]|nr:uridine kinase [Acidobacteriota bacterium]
MPPIDLESEPRWSLADGRPLIIGIAGGSGSGKTTIANAMATEIGSDQCAMILHDSYYRDLSHLPAEERAQQNYDHPDSLETELLVEHLHALVHRAAIDKPLYDFTTHTRRVETESVEPRSVILVEGVLVLAEAQLRQMMDLKIFVDTDADVRLMRRVERDIRDRGRTTESVFEQYLATVRPMHVEFVEPSKAHADLVIPEGYNIGAVGTVLAMVREFLRSD